MTNENEKFSTNDLQMMMSVIDVCSERGAFKGDELYVVGTLRQKLSNFIESITPATLTPTSSPETSEVEFSEESNPPDAVDGTTTEDMDDQ